MTPVVPIIAATCTALLGLLAVLLAVRVIVYRGRLNVQTGDGGRPELAQALRAHANLTEHGPFALLLLAFAEAAGTWRWLILVLAVALIVGRLLSAWGLSHSLGPTTPRQSGAGLTLLVTVLSSLLILYRTIGML